MATELTLAESQFVNNKYMVNYGVNQQAIFTIVDEQLGDKRLNVVTCVATKVLNDGTVATSSARILVAGLGDNIVGVKTTNAELSGQQITRETMGECTIILYEEDA